MQELNYTYHVSQMHTDFLAEHFYSLRSKNEKWNKCYVVQKRCCCFVTSESSSVRFFSLPPRLVSLALILFFSWAFPAKSRSAGNDDRYQDVTAADE